MKPIYFIGIVFGIALAMLGLWGGSYMVETYRESWMGFPALVTAVFFFLSGGMLTLGCFIEGVSNSESTSN